MEIEFRDRRLEACYGHPESGVRAWGDVVARKFVQRVNQIAAAQDQRELYALRSLRLHQLTGDRAGRWAMVVHGSWRLELTFAGNTAVIEEVTNHYGD